MTVCCNNKYYPGGCTLRSCLPHARTRNQGFGGLFYTKSQESQLRVWGVFFATHPGFRGPFCLSPLVRWQHFTENRIAYFHTFPNLPITSLVNTDALKYHWNIVCNKSWFGGLFSIYPRFGVVWGWCTQIWGVFCMDLPGFRGVLTFL